DVLAAVEELQRLDEELDLADAARAQLQVLAAAAGRLALGPLLERAQLVDGAEAQVFAPHERLQPRERFLADAQFPRDGPRLEERETLPAGALRLVIQLQAAGAVDDRPAASLGAQIEIDAE